MPRSGGGRSSGGGGGSLHYTKSGALDMRYSSSREAMSSYSSTPSYSSYSGGGASSGSSSYSSTPSYSAYPSSGSDLHYKKDGTLDMRYSSSQQAASSSYASTPSYSTYPSSGGSSDLHYKKDGSLDMRYSSSKQVIGSGDASSYDYSTGSSQPASASYSSSRAGHDSYASGDDGLHYKKDGTLDMRYSSSQQAAGSKPAKSLYLSGDGLHYKKDGTPDMRYASSKAAVSQGSSVGGDLHYKKDGTPDMRYRSSQLATDFKGKMQLEPTRSRSRNVAVAGVPDYVPRKKDGMPDMRTKAAKDWVTAEASRCSNTDIPRWVPLKKDGSIDMNTAIGRAFAEALPPQTSCLDPSDLRGDYWIKRMLDDYFLALVLQQQDEYVPPPMPQPVQPIQMPRELSHVRSSSSPSPSPMTLYSADSAFGDELSSVVPDTIAQIDYAALVFDKSADNDGVIGRGAFGVVLKAEWFGLKVAVKKLHLDQLTKKEKDSFRKELLILANLGIHRNLVKLHGYCLSPPCIVMELVSLGSLTNLLHYCEDPAIEAKMTDGRIKKNIVFGIADGMRQLHAARVVHGDVKPQNVLINDDYEPKITDFGLSALRGKTSSSVASKQLDDIDGEPYVIGGTAGYMAPELLDSTSPPDFPSDVYSFGVVLNEVIIEEEPYSDQYANFAGRGPFGAVNYAKQGKRPTIIKKTPKPVEDLIRRCWAADATFRPTFSEILVIIEKQSFVIPNSVEM